MVDVFISYKRSNRDMAEKVAGRVEEAGYSVWWDAALLSGDDFVTEIFEVLKTAKTAIVLWCPEALTSRYVVGEAMFALNKNIYMGAFIGGKIELPPPFNISHVDDITGCDSAPDRLEPILAALRTKLGEPSPKRDRIDDAAQEAIFWRGVADSKNAADLKAYLTRFGDNGLFAPLARARIEALAKPSLIARMASAVSGPPTPTLIPIPAGRFWMGGAHDEGGEAYEDEGPRREVVFSQPFRMSDAPVTFAEYDAFCADSGRARPRDQNWGRGDYPVIHVSAADAEAYCAWLSQRLGAACRLPSEAEWEYAARAGSTSDYPWGGAWDPAAANGAATIGRTTPARAYAPNAFGLYDMIGNVWEWVADPWHDTYHEAPTDGSAWLAGGDETLRTIRGGSWDDLPSALRSSMRGWFNKAEGSLRLGFRVVSPG